MIPGHADLKMEKLDLVRLLACVGHRAQVSEIMQSRQASWGGGFESSNFSSQEQTHAQS